MRALEMLRASPNPTVQELLRCRELNDTVLFSPSQSASGQAFDAAVAICGLLLVEGRLTTGLSDDIFRLASAANRGGRIATVGAGADGPDVAGPAIQLGPAGGVHRPD